MAKLDSISICGLRSFGIDKQEVQTIKFHSPLTLFLGQNGSGKTTVIEAVKYACTGDTPDGTKSGQGFVSDPYMHQVPHVLGFVKLNILDGQGNRATIMRVMKSEKNGRGDLKVTTMDSSIQHYSPDGTKTGSSSRIQDLNKKVIGLLGVPQAILNNVIFCHQEQSLWPLDDGGTLKKKFDEIFESVRYNECVNKLRDQLKKRKEVIKRLNLALSFIKDQKDEVERKKIRYDDKKEKYNRFIEGVSKKEEELLPIDKRLAEISELERNLIELERKKSAKENELKNLVEIQKSLINTIKQEYQGSDEALQQEINSFHNIQEKQEKEMTEYKQKNIQLQESENEMADAIHKKNILLMEIREQMKTYKRKIEERNNLITSLADSTNCTISLNLEEDDDAVQAICSLKNTISEENDVLSVLITELKDTDKNLQTTVDAARDKYVQAEQEKSQKKRAQDEFQKELRDTKAKLRELSVSDDKLKVFERKISAIDNDLQKLTASFNEEEINKDIEKSKKQIKVFEEQLEGLEAENKLWQKNSVLENELQNNRSEILRREAAVDQIKNRYYDSFTKIFDVVPDCDLEEAVQIVQIENNAAVMDITNKINSTQKNVIKVQIDIQHQEKQLNKSRTELKQSKEKVTQRCGDTEYNKKTNDLKMEINKMQKTKGMLSSAKVMYEKFIDDFTTEKSCPLCSTDFDKKQSAIKDIIKQIQDKIGDIPRKLQDVTENLDKTDVLYKKVVELKPINDKIEELSKTVPELENKLRSDTLKLKTDEKYLLELKEQLKKPQELTSVCGKVISSAATIDQHNTDIIKHKEKIESIESSMVKINSERTMHETEVEIENTKLEMITLREKCEKNQTRLHSNNKRCHALRDDKNKLVQDQLNLQKLMQGKPQLLERVKDIETKDSNLKTDIEALSAKIATLKVDWEEAKMDMEAVKVSNDATLETKKNEYYQHKTSLKEIQKLQADVFDMSNKNLEDKFNALIGNATDLKSKKQEITDHKTAITEEINKLRVQLANHEHQYRILQDNSSLREKRKQEKIVGNDLTILRNQIGEKGYAQVSKEKNKLIDNRNKITQEIQMSKGQKEELLTSITEIENDLKRPDNVNIFTTYRNKYIETKVNEAAQKNLELYTKALENAISVFHTTRMKEINKNIRQLWRQIYRGNDIDYIEIHNDVTYTASKRNFKYRVMQMKNETLIEMRGRCSAGQKVLACLIIRIALAEAFTTNCGILALDEPTTNLDRENIESLSMSLAGIINSRRAQKNFQLLVITHDEEFLRTLRNVDSLRYYYRVNRDPRGRTMVTSQPL